MQSEKRSQQTHRYFKIFQHISNYGRILVGRKNRLNINDQRLIKIEI